MEELTIKPVVKNAKNQSNYYYNYEYINHIEMYEFIIINQTNNKIPKENINNKLQTQKATKNLRFFLDYISYNVYKI